EPALAHSVHVDASGLEPDTWYGYRFTVGDRTSPVGRTRTAPASGAEVERLRFAFASCQDYEAGHYTAHEHLSREDVDLVLFLGDYIYEHPPGRGGVRRHRSAAPVDLAGYRRRYGEVKADPALQAAHAHRSEERRVGKEGRSRWDAPHGSGAGDSEVDTGGAGG